MIEHTVQVESRTPLRACGRSGALVAPLLLLLFLSACATTQQLAESAANNAKPAMAPVLTERPPSSSLWPTEPDKFYVGARTFAVTASHNLFNQLSVTLGGQEAIELPRGSATDFRPIDRAQVQVGKVYFRVTAQQTDANLQTETDTLEIVDNVLIAAGTVNLTEGFVLEQPLVVRETSINPRYAGTPDARRESNWRTYFGRVLSSPPGQGGRSHCSFSFPEAFGNTENGGLPGASVTYSFISENCKRLGILRDGVRSGEIELPSNEVPSRFLNMAFKIPPDAKPGSTIDFQIFGEDLLKRVSYFAAKAQVSHPPAPKPCPTNNGAGGNKVPFRFCGVCGDDRIPISSYSCDANEAVQAATKSLKMSGHDGCPLVAGDCPICPADGSNPLGAPQVFTVCVATPAGSFGWNVAEIDSLACSNKALRDAVADSQLGTDVTEGHQATFAICATCPGQPVKRDEIQACTQSQALEMAPARNPGCAVAKCP